MRSRRPLITLFLAASLLVGQWLAAGHDPDHGLQPGAAHACAICVYAHGAGAGALPTLAPLLFAIAAETPVTYVAAMPVAARTRHHPIRGPPQLL
jgi:hypothetical protein